MRQFGLVPQTGRKPLLLPICYADHTGIVTAILLQVRAECGSTPLTLKMNIAPFGTTRHVRLTFGSDRKSGPPNCTLPDRMTFPSDAVHPGSSEVAGSWQVEIPDAKQRSIVSYSSIPVIVGAVDVILMITIALLTGSLYSYLQEMDADTSRHAATALIVAAIFVPILHNRGLYSPAALVNWKSQVHNIIVVWALTFFMFASVAFALKLGSDFSRGAVILFAAVGLIAILLHRTLACIIIGHALEAGALRGRKGILIYAYESPPEPDFIRNIARNFVKSGYDIVQFFHFRPVIPKKQIIDQVIEFTRGSDIADIFFAADVQRWHEISQMAQDFCVIPLPLTLLPDECTAALFRRPSRQLGTAVGVEFSRAPLGMVEQFLKRLLDIVGSIAGIIVLFPLFLIVGVAIKLDSPGPVLFVQTRHGFNGKRFKILKFRTMKLLEDGETIAQAVRGDSRITKIGMWLRKTSIDEIPQFFNVLKG